VYSHLADDEKRRIEALVKVLSTVIHSMLDFFHPTCAWKKGGVIGAIKTDSKFHVRTLPAHTTTFFGISSSAALMTVLPLMMPVVAMIIRLPSY